MNAIVSIIIPVFNRESLLIETMNSIKNQTFKNWECIIVDDHSTDASMDVLRKYENEDARFKCFLRPNDRLKGANSCRNYGLHKATGDYLMFFDSDDLLKENCLENRVSEFSKNENKDILVFSMGIFDYQTKPKQYDKRKVINLNIEQTIYEFIFSNVLPWNVCRPIYKTNFIKGRILFNEKIQNFQDDEFNVRVLYHLKPRYLSIDYTDSYYRFDPESVNKYNSLKGNQNMVESMLEYYKTVFVVLDSGTKTTYRDKLIQKLYNQINVYVQPKINVHAIYKTIKLFDRELHLSTKEYFILYGITFLNNYFLHKKGYHFLSSKTKRMLLKN